MGEKRKRADRHFKFETTQLHGGQELSLIHISMMLLERTMMGVFP